MGGVLGRWSEEGLQSSWGAGAGVPRVLSAGGRVLGALRPGSRSQGLPEGGGGSELCGRLRLGVQGWPETLVAGVLPRPRRASEHQPASASRE